MNPRETAIGWMQSDPDEATRQQTREMLGDEAALAEHFGRTLSFGTAGIRGALGPGPNRMNRALVRRVTAAIARVLASQELSPEGGPPREGPVVIGYDARVLSESFAKDAASVLTGAGLSVYLFPGVCPTPLLAFSVRALAARAGIMITASHNPPGDNGYKLYGPDGAQIIPPIDAQIAERLAAINADLAWQPTLGPAPRLLPVGESEGSIETRYLTEALRPRVHAAKPDLRIVYTPLHGVGRATALRALTLAGYQQITVVPEQAEPDGTFPTVSFPNPEEPQAMQLALALAQTLSADLVLANDPDADRIAVAARSPDGSWRRLSGDETGTLLAADLLEHGERGPRAVATTVVSSTLLSKIAAAHHARFSETLTGFKWIARAMTGPERFVLGYEEALGVCVGDAVHDKDGISAAVLVADLASHLARQGQTLLDALDTLAIRYGVHHTEQVSLSRPGEQGKIAMARAMSALRERPPREIGGIEVSAVEDLSRGRDGLPPTDLLVFRLGAGRLLLRPSGTEPKLKAYIEVVEPVGADGLGAARLRAADRARALSASVRGVLSALLGP